VSCEGGWHRASKLVNSHQGELLRVGIDHEDQGIGKESLGGHWDRRCHVAGGSHGAGRHHQCGAAGDVGITGGEEDRCRGMGGSQVSADRQRGCSKRENTTAEVEFESIRFKEGEYVNDFTMRLGSLVAALGTLGEEIKDQGTIGSSEVDACRPQASLSGGHRD
jgi:hypothetical protein